MSSFAQLLMLFVVAITLVACGDENEIDSLDNGADLFD